MYDFDRHIKKRAGEYGLEPREQVWDRIEQELDAKKTKRRGIWLWWLLPILLVGGSVATYNYVQRNNVHEATVAYEEHPINTTTPKETQEKNSTADLSSTTPVATESLSAQAPLQHFEKQPINGKTGAGENAEPPVKKELKSTSGVKTTNSRVTTDYRAQDGIKTGGENMVPEKPIVLLDTLSGNIARQNELTDPDVAEKISPEGAMATVALTDTGTHISSVALQSDSLNALSEKTFSQKPMNKPSKAAWNFVVGAGLHNMTTSGFGLEKSMADYNNNIPQNSTGGSFGNASTQLVPTKPGAGFMLGIERSQAFGQSKRWSWMAGLHYQYQTMQITTGTRVDSTIAVRTDAGIGTKSASYYYRGGNSIEHTGSQHRAHIIAAVQLYIGKKQKWSWQNGFYGGVVLANDYLLPQSSVTGWVPSKELVKTGYFGIETGIKFQPGKIGAGLFAQYNLTSTVNASSLPKQYWRGVELRIIYKLPSSSYKK